MLLPLLLYLLRAGSVVAVPAQGSRSLTVKLWQLTRWIAACCCLRKAVSNRRHNSAAAAAAAAAGVAAAVIQRSADRCV
jgi:hypothetical protein